MKECKCPLCKGQRCFLFASNVYFLEGNFYSFYKCKICDVIFTHPLPSELLIKNLYNTTYFEKDYNFGFLEGDYFSSFESREKEFFWITENIKRYFRGDRISILDVGAAGGAFVKYCKDIGWEAVGYDICEELVSRAKKMFDVDIFTSIEVLKKKGKFDVIFLGDTLEHLVNPNKTISIFREMLSSSGMIVIFTPTYLNSINYFILNKIYHFLVEKIRLTSKRNLNFERLGRFNLNNASLSPYHIYEFSPKSICFLLRRNGFKIVAVKYTVPIPYSLNRESNIGKVINFILRMAKFTAENFYFPRIKTLVIATKHGE